MQQQTDHKNVREKLGQLKAQLWAGQFFCHHFRQHFRGFLAHGGVRGIAEDVQQINSDTPGHEFLDHFRIGYEWMENLQNQETN